MRACLVRKASVRPKHCDRETPRGGGVKLAPPMLLLAQEVPRRHTADYDNVAKVEGEREEKPAAAEAEHDTIHE